MTAASLAVCLAACGPATVAVRYDGLASPARRTAELVDSAAARAAAGRGAPLLGTLTLRSSAATRAELDARATLEAGTRGGALVTRLAFDERATFHATPGPDLETQLTFDVGPPLAERAGQPRGIVAHERTALYAVFGPATR